MQHTEYRDTVAAFVKNIAALEDMQPNPATVAWLQPRENDHANPYVYVIKLIDRVKDDNIVRRILDEKEDHGWGIAVLFHPANGSVSFENIETITEDTTDYQTNPVEAYGAGDMTLATLITLYKLMRSQYNHPRPLKKIPRPTNKEEGARNAT